MRTALLVPGNEKQLMTLKGLLLNQQSNYYFNNHINGICLKAEILKT